MDVKKRGRGRPKTGVTELEKKRSACERRKRYESKFKRVRVKPEDADVIKKIGKCEKLAEQEVVSLLVRKYCNEVPNLDQTGARLHVGANPKLFLIAKDRLKMLATLAHQVCQICEEIYEAVEIKPSGSAACIQWSCPNGHGSEFCTQEMNNMLVGGAKSSAARNISQEGTLRTSDLGLGFGDETTMCTTEEVHSIPVPKKTTSKKLVNKVKKHKKHKRSKDILVVKTSTAAVTSGNRSRETETVIASDLRLGFGDETRLWTTEHEKSFLVPKKRTLEKFVEMTKERNRSEDILVDPITLINAASDDLEMTESGTAINNREIQNEESECQTVRTEYNSDTDNVALTQPETTNSTSTMEVQADILNEVPDWQMVKVKIEPDSDSERGMEQSDGENTSGQLARTNRGGESRLCQENKSQQ